MFWIGGRGGRLLEVPTVRLDWESFGILDKWSLMRGGRTWRFDCK